VSVPLTFDGGMTRANAQRVLAEAFAAAGLDSAALDARVLLCAALAIDHAGLVRDPDLPLGEAAASLVAFARRRLMREPVSRILGRREFFGETYIVDPAVLDPRPDTETLVEAVFAVVEPRKSEALRVLDLGVGSGAILGALLRGLPQATGFGIDLSPEACAVARKNLDALGLSDRAFILAGAWLAPVAGRFDVIVSNPPYIRSTEIDGLDPEVRLHDPHLALDGGPDGLSAYRSIATTVAVHLASGGVLALEFGEDQLTSVESILRAAGLEPIGSRRDLAGRDRVILARLEFSI
jgi:release factor glutamine methyltransferase